MKHSIFVKFIAVLLTAISLVAAIGGVLGIIAMESSNLYVDGVDKIRDNEYRAIADAVAIALHTPVGVLLHTGDFKIDFTPVGPGAEYEKLAELGQKGLLCGPS